MIRARLLIAVLTLWSICPSSRAAARLEWNPKAAAEYLDHRATWWISWPGAARDRGTVCVSCHTAEPYALARLAVRNLLGQKSPASSEQKLLDSIRKRVRLWNEIQPFYGEAVGLNKAIQSRGTESVLSALILADNDAGSGKISADTQAAFENMWRLQDTSSDQKGSWPWLDFGNEPFEARDSRFYGAALAAVAAGMAPADLQRDGAIRNNLSLLRQYLNSEYTRQTLINQTVMLWASASTPSVLTPMQRAAIIQAILSRQQADGGWSLASMVWSWTGSTPRFLLKIWLRSENPPLQSKSDGYATGLVTYALEKLGFAPNEAHVQRAVIWLTRNQMLPQGRWPGYSPNHRSDRTSPTSLFMSDAATAYAVLALTAANH